MKERGKVKKKSKGKLKRNLGVLLYITAFIVVITISVLYQTKTQSPTIPKKPADQYFSFSEGFAVAKPLGTSLNITVVGFNITAIGGNATNIHILGEEIAEEDSFIIPELIQGSSQEVAPITYAMPIVVPKEENGWPLRFRISCNEAYGFVTIYVTDYVGAPASQGS